MPPAIYKDTIQQLGTLLAFGIQLAHESPSQVLVGVVSDAPDVAPVASIE
jgi:hypothetical protein